MKHISDDQQRFVEFARRELVEVEVKVRTFAIVPLILGSPLQER